MQKYIFVSIVIFTVACLGVSSALSCTASGGCNNGVCTNNTCDCLSGYSGLFCEYEQANCSQNQLRAVWGDYQICVFGGAENAWAPVCSHPALCRLANTSYPICEFSCESNCIAGCLHVSNECKTATNTTADCQLMSQATNLNISHFLLLFAICSTLFAIIA